MKIKKTKTQLQLINYVTGQVMASVDINALESHIIRYDLQGEYWEVVDQDQQLIYHAQ